MATGQAGINPIKRNAMFILIALIGVFIIWVFSLPEVKDTGTAAQADEFGEAATPTLSSEEQIKVWEFIAETQWANFEVCLIDTNPYCQDVGKSAVFQAGPERLRGKRAGRILGVVWRPEGSVISQSGEPLKLSPRNAYYYLIDPSGKPTEAFIIQARYIRPE